MLRSTSTSNRANGVLTALPPEDYRRISSLLSYRPLQARQKLQRRGEPVREIYFPERSLCSFVISMEDGATAEVAVVGSEGFIGGDAMLGLPVATCDVVVQVAGEGRAYAMNVDDFQHELDERGALYSACTRYLNAFMGFVTQSVACNGLHTADARCCRWLLHAQDRLGTTEMALTHELLATMLGVRRPTVTLIMQDLVSARIVSTNRGATRIVDRAALEARACECYGTVKAVFDNRLAKHIDQTHNLVEMPPSVTPGSPLNHGTASK